MANSNSLVNPWVLDTAGVITTLDVWIQRIEWHPNAADNDLVIHNRNAEAVLTARAAAGAPNHETYGIETWDYSDRLNGEGKLFAGFDLETIDGGTLYVYRTV